MSNDLTCKAYTRHNGAHQQQLKEELLLLVEEVWVAVAVGILHLKKPVADQERVRGASRFRPPCMECECS